MIDWTDPTAQVTPHFSVHECCWLPSWGRMHAPTEQEQANLEQLCRLMEKVRLLYGPVRVHCMIRPADYNAAVGGAPHSAHILGLACDFDVPGMNCDDLRAALESRLDDWGCRMERRPGGTWVHLDLAPVPPGGNRYFQP